MTNAEVQQDSETIIAPEQSRRRKIGHAIGKTVLLTGLTGFIFTAGMWAESYGDKNAGPKNGITRVDVVGCGDLVGDGPKNDGDFKITDRVFKSLGLVDVQLVTTQVSEDNIRDPGMFNANSVVLNQLTITCAEPLPPKQQTQLSVLLTEAS